MNRQFAELAQLRRFATAVVATYLATKRSFSVCNAGHPRPLWFQAATGEWSILAPEAVAQRAANLPLGIDDESDYEQFAVALGVGDLIVIYTDALIEAHDGSGNMLGEEGLRTIAAKLDPNNLANLGPAILAGVEAHRGGAIPDDDVTLVVLRHTARGPKHLSVAEKIDVYAKVFGLKTV